MAIPMLVKKTTRPLEEPYTSGESLGVTQGVAPELNKETTLTSTLTKS
jgi:hypothetical protein